MKYCNKCGFKLDENAKFCSKCGNNVGDIAVSDGSFFKEEKKQIQSPPKDYVMDQWSTKKDNSFDSTRTQNRLYTLDDDSPSKPMKWIVLSVFRYIFGIIFIIMGFTESSIIPILGGISLFPFLYRFIESKLNLQDNGKKYLRVVSIILPILLLLTPISSANLTEIEILNSKGTISIGEVIEMEVKTNISGYDKSELQWKSSNTSVATITNGYLSGISEGTSVISVVSKNGIKTEFTVAVKKILINDIKVSGFDILYTGMKQKLNVSITPSNATNQKLSWTSSNPAVATVDQSGNVTAIAKGETLIKSSSVDGKSTEHLVTVYQSVESLVLSKTDLTLKEGVSTTITVTVSPKSASDSPIEWRSSDQSIAKIENGKIIGNGPGKATITVIVGNKTISTNVTVQRKSPISVVNFRYTKNTVGGIEWTYRLRNNTSKTINYIYLTWYNFNAVGDPVYDEITGRSYTKLKFTGPLNAGSTSTSRSNATLFYNHSYKSSIITEVVIEYNDGTSETVKLDQMIYLYDLLVSK